MQKPLSPKRLSLFALTYLARFDCSSEKLRQVLNRRVLRQKRQNIPVDEQTPKWIEAVIQQMQNLGYIDDKRYVENAIRRLSESGKSARYIYQKLQADGIDTTLIESLLDNSEEQDIQRAIHFAHKKHLGKDYKKDLEKLARAGFSYEVAKQTLDVLSHTEESP